MDKKEKKTYLKHKIKRENDKNLPLIPEKIYKNLNEEEDENITNEDKKIDTDIKKYSLYSKIKKKIIIIIEEASLELSQTKKPKIMNGDEFLKLIKKMKKDPNDYHPEIIHQILLNIFDSPLNKVGLVKVYIHTINNILIDINQNTRIPRTFKRFCGLFTQLLLNNEINTFDNKENLLKVINYDKLINIIGKNTPKILISNNGRLVDIDSYCENLNKNTKENQNICFIINGNSKSNIDNKIKYNDDIISISSYEIPSNIIGAKICTSFENVWEIF